jgi:hypothetical protein
MSNNNVKYVVIRNGTRVSDLEYPSKEEAKTEYDHWHKIITRWPDGSKLEIVEVKGK